MASYHFSAQPVKRSEGRSAVAMAAYRAGERLKDERRGVDVDFRRRRGVVHTEIVAPPGAARWLLDRSTLWNGVERMEKRHDAQLAREINVALPHELSAAERLELVRAFVQEQFVARGMVADIALHVPVVEKGDDPRNFHAHVMLTLRQAGPTGLRRVKTREWNSDRMLAQWRQAWSRHQNAALARRGHVQRVDHRSLAVQRENAVARGDRAKAATLHRLPEVHVGPKARKASRNATPRSKPKVLGRRRKGGKRLVAYEEIDRGSRREWNMQKLSRNAKAFARMVEKTQVRRARMQRRLDRYNRLLNVLSSPAPAPKRSAPVGVAGLLQGRSLSRSHILARRRQLLWMIEQLDRLFLALLGIREAQLVRHTAWANRVSWRSHHKAPAAPRMRGRRRLLPSL
jgi:hypothetical protein